MERLRTYVAVGAQSFRTTKQSLVRKKLKK
jgi:hypothetical protein